MKEISDSKIKCIITMTKNKIRCMLGKHNYSRQYIYYYGIYDDVCINCGKIEDEELKKPKLYFLIKEYVGYILCVHNIHDWEEICIEEGYIPKKKCVRCGKIKITHNDDNKYVWKEDKEVIGKKR